MAGPNKDEAIARLETAVRLNGEAQNAYDFKAYAIASNMRRDSSAILLPLFEQVELLRETFPFHWTFLKRGDEDNQFSAADLERAREILGSRQS